MSLVEPTSDSVAGRFLQTVVVVDDDAYTPQGASPDQIATVGNESIDEPDESVESQASDLESAKDSDLEDFNTEVIVEGFADLGLNCAVLKPSRREQDKDTERLLRLATRADVVILDWVIRTAAEAVEASTHSNPASRTTLGLLLEVIRHDEKAGSRVRLICVYTGQVDTKAVIDEIKAALKRFEDVPVDVDENKLRIDRGEVRIVILRKHREHLPRGAMTIPAAKLPERVVKEFHEFACEGLLPEIALQSLSAVRDQSHKLLRRFSGNLDPALISHSSTTSPAVAQQFALALVGDELRAIVAATDAVGALRADRIPDYVKDKVGDRGVYYYWTSRANSSSAKKLNKVEAIRELTPCVDPKFIKDERSAILKQNHSRTSLLLEGEEAAVRKKAYDIDLQFSALSSLSRDRNYEGEQSPKPELRLGALLRTTTKPSPTSETDSAEDQGVSVQSEHATQFWACMQPLCDSVRLDRPTKFPMMPLRRSKSEDKFDFVVKLEDKYVALETAGLKLSEMSLPVFQPDPQLKVVMAYWKDGVWQFTDEEGVQYTWLGDLRIDKAHKVLHSVVTTAGRIGIDEYEYYRNASSRR